MAQGTPLIERNMWLRIHFILHTYTSAACAGAWNGEWHGEPPRGDNARTITMTEPRATRDSVQRAADTRVSLCVRFVLGIVRPRGLRSYGTPPPRTLAVVTCIAGDRVTFVRKSYRASRCNSNFADCRRHLQSLFPNPSRYRDTAVSSEKEKKNK